MELPILPGQTWRMTLFWGLMLLCVILTLACIFLAIREVGQPSGGFAFNSWGQVMKANETDFVFFDSILAVADRQVQSHDRPGTVLREVIRQTPQGTPLTYRIQRGQTVYEVRVPVQVTTRKRLAIEFGLPLLVALGQLGMGALVFLLRPNTKRSWVFLGFCVVWFCLFVTIYDFQSTYAFPQLFLFSWFLSSAVLLHLAFVFPEERPCIRQHPRRQYLLYLPSLFLWGFNQICNTILRYNLFDIGSIVRRTLTYSVLTGTVISAYLVFVWVFNDLLHDTAVSQSRTLFEGATGTRWTFTATGPVTNLAARIGAFATGGTIYVGETTAQRLSDVFELRDLGPQLFKNVREPVTVYEVLG